MTANEIKADDGQLHNTAVHGGACRKDKQTHVALMAGGGGPGAQTLHAACRTRDDTPQDGKQQRDSVAPARNPKYAPRPDAHGGLRCVQPKTVHG